MVFFVESPLSIPNIKGAPWDDINFDIFYEVVYPADHDFIFFKIFKLKKTHFSTTLIRIQRKPPTNYLYS